MDVLCEDDSSLTILTFFGNLQLVGKPECFVGIEQWFAIIENEYEAENVAVPSMALTGALASNLHLQGPRVCGK
jgi:hypothetical protein